MDAFTVFTNIHHSVGDLRLQLPQLLTSYNGSINATAFGNQCVQQTLNFPSGVPNELLADITPFVSAFGGNPNVAQSEDCECPSSRLVQGEGGGGADGYADDDDDRLELERHRPCGLNA